jgi:rhamnosyltransferase
MHPFRNFKLPAVCAALRFCAGFLPRNPLTARGLFPQYRAVSVPRLFMTKRLGIFLFFDADGIADDYVVHLLASIRPCLSHLLIVANGKLLDGAREKLAPLADELVVRPNEGFDTGAWKEALFDHVGESRFAEYDELVLLNDSFFAPFRPFETIFRDMEGDGADFWGLSVHGSIPGDGTCPYGFRPDYLQTYFLVFRARLFHSPDFAAFWKKQPRYKTFRSVAEGFGGVLTRHFGDLGYKWSVYSDTRDLDTVPERNYDHHTHDLDEMVARRRYPIIKRRSFRVPKMRYLAFGDATTLPRALAHVRELYPDYDMGPMFAHLLRKYPARDLKEALNLDFVLAAEGPVPDAAHPRPRTLVATYLVDAGRFPLFLPYLDRIPRDCGLLLVTDTEAKRARLLETVAARRPDVRSVVVESHPVPQEMEAFLLGVRPFLENCDLVGFLHDSNLGTGDYPCVDDASRRLLWDNMLASVAYVQRIRDLFAATPWLGVLAPPLANHATFFRDNLNAWAGNFKATAALLEKLGVSVPLDPSRPPFILGNAWWVRTDAIAPLLSHGWTAAGFHGKPRLLAALERSIPHVAQSRSYASGWVMTTETAGSQIANLRYMLDMSARRFSAALGLRMTDFSSYFRCVPSLKATLVHCFRSVRPMLAWRFGGRFAGIRKFFVRLHRP